MLGMRTDKPEAELYLCRDDQELDRIVWHADRQLSDTLHRQINKLLETNKASLEDVQAVVIYEGPGSFTGLRIGFSVANALANSLGVPIVATTGERWLDLAITRLRRGEDAKVARPEYGASPNITQPKK